MNFAAVKKEVPIIADEIESTLDQHAGEADLFSKRLDRVAVSEFGKSYAIAKSREMVRALILGERRIAASVVGDAVVRAALRLVHALARGRSGLAAGWVGGVGDAGYLGVHSSSTT